MMTSEEKHAKDLKRMNVWYHANKVLISDEDKKKNKEIAREKIRLRKIALYDEIFLKKYGTTDRAKVKEYKKKEIRDKSKYSFLPQKYKNAGFIKVFHGKTKKEIFQYIRIYEKSKEIFDRLVLIYPKINNKFYYKKFLGKSEEYILAYIRAKKHLNTALFVEKKIQKNEQKILDEKSWAERVKNKSELLSRIEATWASPKNWDEID